MASSDTNPSVLPGFSDPPYQYWDCAMVVALLPKGTAVPVRLNGWPWIKKAAGERQTATGDTACSGLLADSQLSVDWQETPSAVWAESWKNSPSCQLYYWTTVHLGQLTLVWCVVLQTQVSLLLHWRFASIHHHLGFLGGAGGGQKKFAHWEGGANSCFCWSVIDWGELNSCVAAKNVVWSFPRLGISGCYAGKNTQSEFCYENQIPPPFGWNPRMACRCSHDGGIERKMCNFWVWKRHMCVCTGLLRAELLK